MNNHRIFFHWLIPEKKKWKQLKALLLPIQTIPTHFLAEDSWWSPEALLLFQSTRNLSGKNLHFPERSVGESEKNTERRTSRASERGWRDGGTQWEERKIERKSGSAYLERHAEDGKRGRGSAAIQMGAIATGSERSRAMRKGRAAKEGKHSPSNSCKTVIIWLLLFWGRHK